MQTTQEEEVFEEAKEEMVEEEHAEISLCVAVGITSSSSILKIVWYVKELPFWWTVVLPIVSSIHR